MRHHAIVAFVLVFAVHVASACSASDGTTRGTGGASGNGGSASGDSGAGGVVGGASSLPGEPTAVGGDPKPGVTGVGEGEECSGLTQETANKLRPVDIIWAIDNSGSMLEEIQGVQMHMNNFANQIGDAGLDVHVVVLSQEGPPLALYPDPIGLVSGVCIPAPLGSGTCPDDNNPPGYLHVFQEIGSTTKFHQILEAYPRFQSALRRNALKYFAVVTDDTDSDAQFFVDRLAMLDVGPPNMFQDWKFFGVFCTGAAGCPTSGGSQVLGIPCVETGTPYLDLVARTDGLAGDLCAANADFGGVFAELAKTVVEHTQIDCEWTIPPPPAGEVFDARKVNVNYTPSSGVTEPIYFAMDPADCGMGDGWYYDNPATPTRIIACPATCARVSTDMGGRMDLVFGCATIPVVL